MPSFSESSARPSTGRCSLPWSREREVDALPGDDVSGIVLAGAHRGIAEPFDLQLRGPLIPVAHAPVISYPLEWLRAGGVRSAIVCANSETDNVRARLGNGARLGIALDYFADHTPRGPAGCARDAARRSPASTFVVVEGALIPSLDLPALLRAHRESGAAATVVVEIDRRRRATRAEPARQPGGVYLFERRVLAKVADRGYQDIKQGLLERLHAARERIAAHEVAGVSPRVLDRATYLGVNAWLIAEHARRPMPLRDGYEEQGEGLHHVSARVDPDACLVGPVLVGANARIDAGAVVVGPTSIGAGSVVRAGALVSRSVVWDRCDIGEACIVASSVLADGSAVGAGERVFDAVQLAHDVVPARRPAESRARAAGHVTRVEREIPLSPAAAVRPPDDFLSPVPMIPRTYRRSDELPAVP